MTRFKDFGAGEQSTSAEPLTFKLHGEDFHCKPNLQGKILLDLVKNSGGEDGAKAAEVVVSFFDKVLVEESRIRFNVLIESEKIVTVETLAEITGWLIEQYTDRPNQQPEA